MALIGLDQVRAILWAQWRAMLSYTFRKGGLLPGVLTALFALIWYGMWCFLAWSVYVFSSASDELDELARLLPAGLMLVFGYWQIVPLLMASGGLALDLRRLVVYPIAHRWLFAMEVVLRITTAVEMLLVTLALGAGLWRNPDLPWWSPLPLVPFTLLNLFLAAGLRDLFTRWMTRKYFREAMVLVLVLIAGLPQVLLLSGMDEKLAGMPTDGFGFFWPWSATATLLVNGSSGGIAVALLLAWTAGAWWFVRRQFERSLRFDAAEARAADRSARRGNVLDVVTSMASRVFSDPLGALVEKELRSLSRAPRFRLLFLMGFSFGLLIWIPLAFSYDDDSVMRTNYLTIVSAYALMLLGEVCFWNSFGLDRSAATTYFVMPVKVSTVLAAKNIAGALFIALELLIVSGFCLLLRLPVDFKAVAEAFLSTSVLAVFLFAAGNLLSVRYPRAIDPNQSLRGGSMGRIQAYLLFIYPLAAAPILLAHGARYAFDSDLAFYGVLAVDLLLAISVYSIALESAGSSGRANREHLLESLSAGQGPVGG